MLKGAPRPTPRSVFSGKAKQPIDVLRLVRWQVSESERRILLVAARRDGEIQILDLESGKERFQISISLSSSMTPAPREPEQIVSVDHWQGDHNDPLVLLVCTNLGRAQVTTIRPSGELKTSMFDVTGPIDVMRVQGGDVAGRHGPCIAFGGKENDLQIWTSREFSGRDASSDIAWFMLDSHWQAKNVKDDELGLRVPVWISDLQFLPAATDIQASGYRIATCTRYNHVRLYDTSKSRRPIVNIEVGQYPLTRLCTMRSYSVLSDACRSDRVLSSSQSLQLNGVVVTDTHGNVHSYDLKTRKPNGSYKGFSCAVSDIAFDHHHTNLDACDNHLCVAGVDGFLRTYDITTRKQISCLYTGRKIAHVCADTALAVLEISAHDQTDIKAEDDVEGDEDDENDVWEGLEEVDQSRALDDGRRAKRIRR